MERSKHASVLFAFYKISFKEQSRTMQIFMARLTVLERTETGILLSRPETDEITLQCKSLKFEVTSFRS